METWQAIVAGAVTLLGTVGAGFRWFLGWIDKRDKAFLEALEKNQIRLERVSELRVEDARAYAKAYAESIDPLKEALERLQSPPR